MLCNLETGQHELLLIHDAEGVAFARDGRTLVTSDGQVVRVWELERLRALGARPAEPSGPLMFSPDGRRLVAGDWLCDGATGRRLQKLTLHRGQYLEGGPPRNNFFCGTARTVSVEGGVSVWDTESGAQRDARRVYYAHWHMMAFSADGLRYVVARKGVPQFEVLDVDTGAIQVRILMERGRPVCLAFSPDGQWVACGTEEGWIGLWSVVDGRQLVSLSGHTSSVSDMAFSRDGRRLVSAGYNEALRIWELPSGAVLASRPLDEREASEQHYERGATTTRRRWYATTAALRALSGWEGFVGPPSSPFTAEVRGGVTLFSDSETRRPVAAFPLGGRWLMHPDGVTWAALSAHVILEGRRGGR